MPRPPAPPMEPDDMPDDSVVALVYQTFRCRQCPKWETTSFTTAQAHLLWHAGRLA